MGGPSQGFQAVETREKLWRHSMAEKEDADHCGQDERNQG
jgi:hypothetical protein